MAFQVTQCPQCESTFHTNPRILEMAAGKVRCGACLTVFLAEDNFLSQGEQDSEDAGQESVFIGHDPGEFFDPSVFISRTALRSGLTGADETRIEAPQNTEPEQTLELPEAEADSGQTVFELPDPPLPEAVPEEEIFSAPIVDPESIAEATQEQQEDQPTLVEADEHQEFFAAIDSSLEQYGEADDISDLEEIAAMEPPGHGSIPEPTAAQSEARNPHSASDEEAHTAEAQAGPWSDNTSLTASFSMDYSRADTAAGDNKEQDEQEQQTTRIITSGTDDNLEELVRQAIAEQDFTAAVETGMQEPSLEATPEEGFIEDVTPPGPTEVTSEAAAEDNPEQAFADEPEPELSTEAIRARAMQQQQQLRDEDALDEIPAEHLASLKQIATPLELSGARQRSWGSQLGLLALTLLLGAALAGQYLWRYRDNYSIDPRFRTVYEFVCQQYQSLTLADCDLPRYSEISAIRSENLAVRSHPQREDGLMVTVELRNTARFPQPFPVLILGFNTASNEVIALREFAPEEYLDPGLRQFELMPVASPVQISLPIMDPGEDAINYTLAFRAR